MNSNADPLAQFANERTQTIASYGSDTELTTLTNLWRASSMKKRYVYNFDWMGRPIIQYPQDMVAMQEILWRVKPDLVVETGIAHGGSIVFYASILELIGHGSVLGIDARILEHVRSAASGKRVLVVLDSNHTHDHVLAELNAYAPLTAVGSYCVVMDTVVEDLPPGHYVDRPWDVGNNPKTAVREFLKKDTRFQVDPQIQTKLQITVAPDGYLQRIR